MSKATLALLKMALLLCVIAMLSGGGLPAFGQAGATPAPISTPTPADIHAGATLLPHLRVLERDFIIELLT